jgi:hypothetical protein
MGLKIEYFNSSYPRGAELGIQDVGVIKNGGSLVLSDDQVKALVDRHNENLGEGESKWTIKDLFTGDMFTTSKVADPTEPSEEGASELGVPNTGLSEGGES